jgi:hypothetical protein
MAFVIKNEYKNNDIAVWVETDQEGDLVIRMNDHRVIWIRESDLRVQVNPFSYNPAFVVIDPQFRKIITRS